MLPNGLRVVTEAMPHSRTFSVGCFVDVGSAQETPRTHGASHFLEHVLFKGTRARTAEQISAAVESVGGDLNAYTSKEHTCFYARVLAEHAELAVDVITDMITGSLIRGREVQAERSVILDEIAMHADDPVDLVQDLVTAELLPSPGLGAPVIGTAESIAALSRDQIVRHWRRSYHPGSIVISAAGRVDHDRLVEQLSGIGDFGTPVRRRRAPGPTRADGPAVVSRRRRYEQTTATLAWRSPGLFDPDRYPLGLLSVILGGGMSSRLFLEVRERRGMAYGIEAGEAIYSTDGIWSVDWQCAPAKVADILVLVRAELERIAEHGVDESELERARNQLRGQTVLALEGPQSRMNRLGTAEISEDQQTVAELLDRYDRVRTDDVGAIAARMAATPAVLGLVGPQSPTRRLEKLIS